MKKAFYILFLFFLLITLSGCKYTPTIDHTIIFHDELTFNVNETISPIQIIKKVDSYIVKPMDYNEEERKVYVSDFYVLCPEIKSDTLGTFSLDFLIGEEKYKADYIIKDLQAPIITIDQKEITIEQGQEPKFNYDVTDNYDQKIEVTLIGEIDSNLVGTQTITINAKDTSGNQANETITFIITQKEEQNTPKSPLPPDNDNQNDSEVTPPANAPTDTSPSTVTSQSKDYLFSDGYTLQSASDSCQNDLINSGRGGYCVPLKDESGIYKGMRLTLQ